MGRIFFIPNTKERNTKIKQSDIDKGILRICQNNKQFFPEEGCVLKIIVDDVEYSCDYIINNNINQPLSCYINLGKELFEKLNIKNSDILECIKIDDKIFKLSK
jgi:hypothetical protein